MSWFDTAGFASLAKSALKEAQKTFDKALDLEAVDEKETVNDSKEKDDADSFFSSFGLGGAAAHGSAGSAAGSERMAASLWDSLGASLLREQPPAPAAAAAAAEGQPAASAAVRDPDPVMTPPDCLPGIDRTASGDWREPPPPLSPSGDVAVLRADSPATDGFQSSVLVVASPSSEWPPPLPPAADVATTPESIEVLDGDSRDWEAGWEAGGDSTGTLHDGEAPPESLHSSNSSCHTLISADGGAAYSAKVASPSVCTAESSVEGNSSESFIRLGGDAVPLTSPDVSSVTSPESELVMSPDVGEVMSPDVEVVTSPDVEVVTSPENELMASPDTGNVTSPDVELVTSSEAGNVTSPDVEVLTSPDVEVVACAGVVSAVAADPGRLVSAEVVTSPDTDKTEKADSAEPRRASSPGSSEPADSTNGSVEPASSSSECVEPAAAAGSADREERLLRPDSGTPPRDAATEPASSGDSGGRGLSPHESGHTSADEIETATSSDVEVLISPLAEARGPSAAVVRGRRGGPAGPAADRADTPSSDGSHPPPAAQRDQCHRRNLSQTSVASSDLEPDCDRWPRRVAELQDVLAAREAKMLDLSRLNVTLQEENSNLQSRVELLESQLAHSSASGGHQEKLAAERDALHKQLTEVRRRCAGLEEAVLERDTTVEELRAEGEKLSRDQLKLNTVIKRLRAKEREQEAASKKQEDRVSRLTAENAQLTEQLGALKDTDREQSRVHKQLTAQLARVERDAAEARHEASEARDAATALETALQTAHRDVAELERKAREHDSEAASQALSAEIQAKQELERSLTEYKSSVAREQDDLLAQIEDLRVSLRRAERENARREDGYQAETAELQRRLLDSEARNQQLADSVAMATRPLQRQLETLQAALSTQQHSWERAERALTEKNADLQRQLAAVTERERHVTDQYVEASARQAPLEASLAELRAERSQMADKIAAAEARLAEVTATVERGRTERQAAERQLSEQLVELRSEKESLERQLETERAALLAERARNAALQQQARERVGQLSHSQSAVGSVTSQLSTPRTSPTPSLSRISFSSSAHELDGVFDPVTPRVTATLYETVRAGQGAAAVVESLTSQLKQREGELAQLRSERSDLETARQQLSGELARVSAQLEQATDAGRQLQARTAEFQQLQSTYNALLQMYGEKAEESEELKLDLADVKEMYKQQIDQLTKRSASS